MREDNMDSILQERLDPNLACLSADALICTEDASKRRLKKEICRHMSMLFVFQSCAVEDL